ncbi:MAG: phosphotransferase [Chloroflexia bacterium]
MKPFNTLGKRGQVARLKRVAEKALDDFGMREVSLTPLVHMANTTFRVETADGERYVIRIHTPANGSLTPGRTEDQIRSEMEWLAALRRDTDLVVPVPVRTRDDKLLTRVEVEGVPEARVCVLFRWVDGRFMDEGLTPRHLERVGIFIARLHEHSTRQFVPPEGFIRPTPDALPPQLADEIVNTFAEVRPQEDVAVVRAVIEKMQLVLEALGTGPDVFGLIHADLHQWNYLFRKGEVRAIDFDDCGWAHFLYDLTVTLSELPHTQEYPQLRAALLKGYRSVRPLPEEHEVYLPVLLAFRELQLTTWFIEQREHPAFRSWEQDAMNGVKSMKALAGV